MELTTKETELIRHCVGLDGRHKSTNRNHYVVGPGQTDYEVWTGLVSRGLAYRRAGSEISGGDDIFWVKREAALAVRKPDEHLGREWRE